MRSLRASVAEAAKRAALTIAPTTAARIRAKRNAARDSHAARLAEIIGPAVLTGPFQGMRFVGIPRRRQPLPKLLGSYEAELAGVLELLIARQPDMIINVGCGEGYYAVGLARRLPRATVRAFDTDSEARALTELLAADNGVSQRVQVGGWCTSDHLLALARAAARPLVVVDIEGAELDLLTADACAALAHADLLVELHDFTVTTCSKEMIRRARDTHMSSIIRTRVHSPDDYPALARFTPDDQRLVLEEYREGPMEWLVAVSRDAQWSSPDRAPAGSHSPARADGL